MGYCISYLGTLGEDGLKGAESGDQSGILSQEMDVVEVIGYIEVMPYVTLIPFASFFCLRCFFYGCIPRNTPYRLAAFVLLLPSGCRLISLLTMPAYTNLCTGACHLTSRTSGKYTTLPMSMQQ